MALRRDIAGYPCTETFLLGRLRHDTRPGLTRWRVTIHVSSASHLYPHWALGSHLPDTLAIRPISPQVARSHLTTGQVATV